MHKISRAIRYRKQTEYNEKLAIPNFFFVHLIPYISLIIY